MPKIMQQRYGGRRPPGLRRRQKIWYFDLIAWTAALAVSGYPLVGLLSTYLGIEDDSISVPFRVFVFFLAIIACWWGYSKAPLRAIDNWIAMFLVIYLFRLLWDAYIVNVDGAELALLTFVVTVLVPVIALALTANIWNDRNVAFCFLMVGTIVCGAGVWFILSGEVDLKYFEETGRLGFTKINPISLGHVGTTTVLAAIVLSDGSDSRILKGIALACGCLALVMLYLAASRGPVVAFIACFIAYILFRGAWKYGMIVFLGIFLSIAVFSVLDINALIEHLRLTDIVGVNMDASARERLLIYAEAIEAFKQYPIFGSSFSLPISGGWPHNIFLEAAMAAGTVGLVMLIIVMVRTFAFTMPAFRTDKLMAGFMFLQFVVAAQFSGAIWAASGMWIGVTLVNAGHKKRIRGRRVYCSDLC